MSEADLFNVGGPDRDRDPVDVDLLDIDLLRPLGLHDLECAKDAPSHSLARHPPSLAVRGQEVERGRELRGRSGETTREVPRWPAVRFHGQSDGELLRVVESGVESRQVAAKSIGPEPVMFRRPRLKWRPPSSGRPPVSSDDFVRAPC